MTSLCMQTEQVIFNYKIKQIYLFRNKVDLLGSKKEARIFVNIFFLIKFEELKFKTRHFYFFFFFQKI